MNDPYVVLGVSRSATDDEIKAAYRELAKKYHPDNFNGNPLSDLAEEKMKEINEAYDQIMRSRTDANNARGRQYNAQYSANYGEGFGEGSSSDPFFQEVRNLLSANRIIEAERKLESAARANRGAEWHFLKGCVNLKKGFVNDARVEFSRACTLDPSNAEYAAAYNRINNMRAQNPYGTPYNSNQGAYRTNGMSSCDCCANLVCADCCCEMMGGDLVPCC